MQNSQMYILEQFEIGGMDNFIYFLGDKHTHEIAVVDPAWDVDDIIQKAKVKGYKISKILITHGHPDHINGVKDLVNAFDVPIIISRDEPSYYSPSFKQILKVDNHEHIKIGNLEIECLLTPGHSPGSLCFKYDNILLTGDTLFIDGCGRCDLPGGDAKDMYNSLYQIISKLPDETIIYPGHNYGNTPAATLKSQKETNPYLKCKNINEFLHERMGISF